MSDTLPTLCSDTLTTAVTSLLQRPLPDTDQTPDQTVKESNTNIKKRKKQPEAGKQSKTSVSKQVTASRHTETIKANQTGAKSKQTKKNKQSNNEKSKHVDKTNASLLSYQNENSSKSRKCYVTIPPIQIISETCSSKGRGKKNSKQGKSSSLTRTENSAKTIRTNKKTSGQNGTRKNHKPVTESSSTPEACDSLQKQFPNNQSTLRDLLTRVKLDDQSVCVDEPQSGCLSKTNQIVKCTPETLTKLANSLEETSHSFPAHSTAMAPTPTEVPTTSSSNSSLTGSTSVPTTLTPLTVLSLSHSSRVSTASLQGSHSTAEVTVMSTAPLTDQPLGLQNFSFSTPWVPQHLTDGMVPMLSLGPGLNIPLRIRPANSQLVSAMLSRLPTILPKANQNIPNYNNSIQNQPASENTNLESHQHQAVSIATPVNPNPMSSEEPASLGKAVNSRIEIQQAQLVSMVTSGHPNLQLQLNQPVPVATLDKLRHGPLEHQPVSTISPAKPIAVLPQQSVSIATPVHLSLNSHQHLPVPMSTPGQPGFNPQQHQLGSFTHTAPAVTVQSNQPVLATSHATPAQYTNEPMNAPSIQNASLGDPTGMEIQSLMNIVYGHLMERDRVGTTPTPSSLMLESSFRHFSAPYQAANPPPAVTSQSETIVQDEHPRLPNVMTSHYSFPVVSNLQTANKAQSFESQQEQSIDQDHVRTDNNYQPVQQAIDNEVGMVHQTGLSLHQPHAPAHFIQSNSTPGPMTNQSYLGVNQQQPSEYNHQSVISHTEHLQHPTQVESYQYDGQPSALSTCMYRQHTMGQADGQIGNQRLCHQAVNQNVERYRNHDLSMPTQYSAAEINGNVKEYTAEEMRKSQQTSVQSEHVDAQGHTEELPDTDNKELVGIYCLDCNRQLKKPCHIHNTDYIHIEDSPVLSRARASLPACFYLRKTETMVFHSLAMSRESLPSGFASSSFQIFERDKAICYDMTDETLCNWMMFIQLATSLRSQNCVLYQQGKALYVVTKENVKKDTALLMWFSSDLCLRLKVSQDPSVCKLEQCITCGLQFLSKKLMRSHRKAKHPSEVTDSFTCYLCGKSYSSRTKLNSHTLIHMGVKPHRCIYCNKEFTDYSNLKVHQFIHTGQKKYQCPKCGRTFRQKSHLNSHIVIHTGEKNWKCKYCEKMFARQSDCKTHEYNHTQEKMYTCEVCRKVFYKLQSFKRHQKVHTGERNYMCNKCFKGFHTKYHRDRHLKICKEKSEKESTYMSLEEVANLDNTCDAVPLVVKAHEVAAENQSKSENGHHFQNNMFNT